MSDSQVTVVALIRAKSEYIEDVRRALHALIEPTLPEAGCMNYDLHQDRSDPALFVFHENWETEHHLDQHLESPHLADFMDSTGDKIESLDIKRLARVHSV